MEDKEKSRLDALQQDLYERKFENPNPSVHQHFTQQEAQVERTWRHDTPVPTTPVVEKNRKPFFKKILIAAIAFCTLSVGVALFMFFGGWNTISAKNVDIEFLGPTTISAGNELDFEVGIKNKNPTEIVNAALFISYPDGTKHADDLTKDLLNDKHEVGVILPNEIGKQPIKAVLFGNLNDKRDIKVILTYGLKNSNATFRQEATYSVTINATPITVTVSNPQKVISNDTVELKVTVASNASASLEDLLVKAEYPLGFTFADATPKPDYDSVYWVIPVLKAGEKKEFIVRGHLQGLQGDERVFRFSVGAQDPNNDKRIATQYLTQVQSIFVERPPLAVTVALNSSNAPQLVTELGSPIQGVIEVSNNLSVKVEDAVVEVALNGALLNPQTVQSGNGFFQSNNNTIIWNKSIAPGLGSLSPGEKVTLTFGFATLQPNQTSVRNGKLEVKATVIGKQTSDTQTSTMVSSTDSKTVLTQTSIGLLSQIAYSTGPFRNRGPVPPKADMKTTYTVTWTATNSSNDVRGGEVRATLPTYVKWLGVTSPTNETITWNPDQNEVVWRVGDIAAQTGTTKQAREVSFQIELLPSLGQVNTVPDLVTNTRMTAVDAFTNANLSVGALNLTTRLSNDPQFTEEAAKVIQ